MERLRNIEALCEGGRISSQSYKRTVVFKEKTNQFSPVNKALAKTMSAEKTGTTWINQLSDIENNI